MSSISQLNAQERLRATKAAEVLRTNAVRQPSVPAAPSVTRQPDAVSLSESARSMATALKTVGSAEGVREDRVAAIKAALANGTYAVDSRQLAAAMSKVIGS
jgi:negative regulator of flagellin synthesis FlgM